MDKYTKEAILKKIVEENVQFIRLQFTDIFGQPKNIAITQYQMDKALDNECTFDGSSIEGFVRIEESDMYLRPDLRTFRILPWRTQEGKEARIICDVFTPEGKAFEGDPRNILRKTLKEAEDMGFDLHVGPECEFFLFQRDSNGMPILETNDNADYFDFAPIDQGENARRDMCTTLQQMGFEIEASHHEGAPGQHEIDFKYGEALYTADDIMTFKLVVKTIAKRHGLHATFMPKPIYGINGSGMHLNLSLQKNGENIFFDKDDELGLSQTAYHFVGGLLEHAPSMALVTNPLVNSYKRLVPGYEAPVYIAWSASNRSPLIRIPATRGAGTRVEMRNPDPSANPYLAFALILAAGLDGVKRKLTPPAGVNGNIFSMSKKEREAMGITSLPRDLSQAIDSFEKDPLVKATLGDHLFSRYLAAKKVEWEEYSRQVSQWETDKYLIIH